MKTCGGFLISQIHQLGGRIFDKILKGSAVDEFNGPQGRILYVLWENGNLTITQIGKLTSLANTTLTSMLDRMEASGLVTRTPDLNNRRQIVISTTDKAEALRDVYDCVSNQTNEIFYHDFTEDEIIFFENTLRRILNNLERKM